MSDSDSDSDLNLLILNDKLTLFVGDQMSVWGTEYDISIATAQDWIEKLKIYLNTVMIDDLSLGIIKDEN